jgi:hypothetical protein
MDNGIVIDQARIVAQVLSILLILILLSTCIYLIFFVKRTNRRLTKIENVLESQNDTNEQNN